MSVIMPILDTLLHDVLGRRTAAPALRSMNETVTAVRAAAMLNPPQQDGMSAVSEDLVRPGAPPAINAALLQGTAVPGGVQARLSPVALVIADILGRFPAPPSTLRILTPLISEQVSVSPSLLAAQLQSSITDSGLFYEAHLARWYRGTLALTQLKREPQMQSPGVVRAPAPVGNPVVVGTPSAQNVQQGVLHVPQESTRVTSDPTMPVSAPASGSVSARSAPEQAMDSPSVSRGLPELSEPLQVVVRHQLELLAMPLLRWEGEVWAGLFVQLMIRLPDSPVRPDEGAEGNDNDTGVIESEVTIDLQSLGVLNVRLHLHDGQLGLALRTDSLRCLQHLEVGREGLATRLHDCGFRAPDITMALRSEMDSHD